MTKRARVKRVLGDGAKCCGQGCDLGCAVTPTSAPEPIEAAVIEDLDLTGEEADA